MSEKKYCDLTVVRHGQTIGNITGRLQGQQNSDLDGVGTAQAKAVAARLCNIPFDVLYSSDLGRTMQTASFIAECHNPKLGIIPVKEIREWHLGELEGKTYSDLMKLYPEVLSAIGSHGNISIPGGETSGDFQKRVTEFMDRTALTHIGQKVLVVTHGGALQCMFRHVAGLPRDGNLIAIADNTSISCFRYYPEPDAWQLRSWNDCAHLQDIPIHETVSY